MMKIFMYIKQQQQILSVESVEFAFQDWILFLRKLFIISLLLLDFSFFYNIWLINNDQ